MSKLDELKKLIDDKNPNKGMRDFLQTVKILKGDKGDPGYNPVRGKDYYTEKDINIMIEYIQSKVRDGIDGIDGADGKDGAVGPAGKDAESPVRGIDYWTEKDQAKILKEILGQIPKPKDGITPSTDEVVNKAVDILKQKPIEFKDIRGTEKLVELLKLGGFRGGGTSVKIQTEDGLVSISPLTILKVTNGTLTDDGSGVASLDTGGSGSSILLETNGVPNGDQTVLNLVEGTNMTITDDGMGNITFDATGGSGSGTVTDFVFTDANGFDGTVTNSTTTPTLSLITTVADTRVMFSNSGAMTGDAGLTYSSSTDTLTLASTLVLGASGVDGFIRNASFPTTDYIQFVNSSNDINFISGSSIFLALNGSAAVADFNPNGGNLVYRFRSAGNPFNFVVNAGNNTVGVGIASDTPAALLDIGQVGAGAVVRLEGNTSGYTEIKPAAAVTNWVLTLPPNDGNNLEFLQTNGSGTTVWAAAPVPTTITVANEATDTTCFVGFFTAATGDLQPKTNVNMLFNSNTGVATFASTVLTTTDINGGTIDGTIIGGASAAAGTFTAIVGTSVTDSGLTAGRVTFAGVGGLLSDDADMTFSGSRLTVTDLTVTNTITGSISGNAATVTTNANLTGPITSSGNATAVANSINLPASPTTTTQAQGDNSTKIATTAYVDAAIQSQNYKEAVKYASVAVLPSIVYANGSSGVGRTLTGVALAAISLDGASPGLGDRVLIKNQASDFQNGIYVVTQTGSGIAVFILTGATDADQSNEYKTGDAVFVTAGNTLANTVWAYTGIDNPTIGTTSLTYVQISADLIVGQSSILSGTNTRILYNNNGVLGEYTLTGSGTVAVMQTSPTLITPVLGVAAYTTLTGGNITDSALTSGRVTYAGAAGILKDASTFLFDGTNLGIGATPDSLLTVAKQTTIVAAVSGSTAHFIGLDANPLRITFDTHNAGTSGTALFGRRSRGTAGSPGALVAADTIYSLNALGYGATAYATASTGLISFKAAENFTDTAMGTDFVITTTPLLSVTAAEVARFTGTQMTIGVAGTLLGKIAFSGNTSGATTVQSLAAASGTLTLPSATDTLVGKATTDTFTNKTITSSTDVLGGVTMTLGSDASGDVYYRNSSGILTRVAAGATNTILTMGASSVPAWGAWGYTIQGQASAINPLDGEVRYFGLSSSVSGSTTANFNHLYMPIAGTITKVYFWSVIAGTLGTTETSTLSVRLNNTTDTTVTSSMKHDATSALWSNTGLAIAVAANDFIEMKVAYPTFATNPTNVVYEFVVYISVPS